MTQEFFANLPSEVIIDILSRLPVRTIISCKCVCKSLLGLVQTREFARCHLTKSIPVLAVYQYAGKSKKYKIFEFVDGLDLERQELHKKLITSFDLHFSGFIIGSASGLLSLCDLSATPHGLYICNPITRDYIQLHCPQEFGCTYPRVITYGFGVSKMSGQHKVVRICYNCKTDLETSEWLRAPENECQVYTLGTPSWRRIVPGDRLEQYKSSIGAFLNGNLHWLAHNSEDSQWISCFDLEKELFCTYSIPPLSSRIYPRGLNKNLVVMGNCLCLCDNASDNHQIIVWLMKEYGVEKSWTKEFVITLTPDFARESYFLSCGRHYSFNCDDVYPIKDSEDGDVLMSWGDGFLFCYSTKTSAIKKVDMLGFCCSLALLSPSFLSLHNFEMENVMSF